MGTGKEFRFLCFAADSTRCQLLTLENNSNNSSGFIFELLVNVTGAELLDRRIGIRFRPQPGECQV